jgi:hypothetical protein
LVLVAQVQHHLLQLVQMGQILFLPPFFLKAAVAVVVKVRTMVETVDLVVEQIIHQE